MEIRDKKFRFEEALKKIEYIVKRLEEEELELEEALKLYEEGIFLVKACEEMLKKAKERVEVIIKEEKGFRLESLEKASKILGSGEL
jgi:exodeoxyribonuclease VII small subunit